MLASPRSAGGSGPGRFPGQGALVDMDLEERCGGPLHFGQLPQGPEHVLAQYAAQARRVELASGVVRCDDERRLAGARQHEAHDQGAGAVVALDEELGLGHRVAVDADRLAPGIVALMPLVSLHHLADATALRLIKMALARCDVAVVALTRLRIDSAEHDRVELKQIGVLAALERVDAVGRHAFQMAVLCKKVVDDLVLELVTARGEVGVDLRERALKVPQAVPDAREVDPNLAHRHPPFCRGTEPWPCGRLSSAP